MNYGTIKYCDIANGVGVRTSLFVSGCRLHCPGCFNGEAQDFGFGLPFERSTEDAILDSLRPSYIRGLSLLGGDPMEPENQQVLVGLVERVVRERPEKDIWCYSGYVYDRDLVLGGSHWLEGVTDRLLDCVDVLVDGPFVQAQKDITLRFRGSFNQRLIDLAATRATIGEDGVPAGGIIVPWADETVFATHTMN
ncbi:anaerobic ribonucleoside-triphosphate reductase activating protein [uncultured Parolsenella sp.]|uniref:anaerobic ribonucleoside-triphosphate reductase activating protein n=1 Tax=uncultured Parolsenella sp. TaxID=2083008 RepID=UPI0025CBB337|nr:anaerobic ribonucleoside-triphosphate reductase activating protein [uncultured Parolsenella sp.]